jgi:23S rRNA (adenine2030-N6)-methyltransferase
MLSYRHAFHAGNHADVLKHAIQITILDYLNQKDKPWWYIDSHSGAGLYDLQGDYAQKNAEFNSGIARLWGQKTLPPLLQHYVELVRELNPDGTLKLYPGSPWCAQQCARAEDKLRLFELHSSDHKLLSQNFEGAGRKVRIEAMDGYAGLKSVLPPLTRRAMVLVDPSYELKTDYQATCHAIQDSLVRFAEGTYMVWYPLLQTQDARQLIQQLKALQAKSWLNVSLSVQKPSDKGFGMHGSGLFIVNPPWTLPKILEECMPWLVETLDQDGHGSFHLDHHIP